MANLIDAAFDSIDDDDLFDVLRPHPPDHTPNNPSENDNDNFVAQNINSSQPDLNLNIDNDPTQTSSSKYITENQFKDTVKNFSENTFSLFHLNIRSINKHFEELQLLLDNNTKQPFSIIGLTETWLSSSSHHPFALNGYDFIVNNRQNRTGGGVALYVSQNF